LTIICIAIGIPPGVAAQPVVESVSVVDSSTGAPVFGWDPLVAGAVVDLTWLGGWPNLRVNAGNPAPGSARVEVTGRSNPLTLDGGQGLVFGADDVWSPPLGFATVTVTPYAGAGLTGEAGEPLIVRFMIIRTIGLPLPTPQPTPTPAPADEPRVTGLRQIDRDTGEVRPLMEAVVAATTGPLMLRLGDLFAGRCDLLARTEGPVGSVTFALEGQPPFHTCNGVPFRLPRMQGLAEALVNWETGATPPRLIVTPHTQADARGEVGAALEIPIVLTGNSSAAGHWAQYD
jgi:hypothetical protein